MFYRWHECAAAHEPWWSSPAGACLFRRLAVLLAPVQRKLKDDLVIPPDDGACFLVDLPVRQEEGHRECWAGKDLAVAG